MSYTDFVTKEWKLDPEVLGLYQTRTYGLFGFGVDAVPAQDAFGAGPARLRGHEPRRRRRPGPELRLDPQRGGGGLLLPLPRRQRVGRAAAGAALVPAAVPGTTADDIVTAKVDYAKLDDAGVAGAHPLEQHGRARGARRAGRRRPTASRCTYLRGGTLHSVRARRWCSPAGTT